MLPISQSCCRKDCQKVRAELKYVAIIGALLNVGAIITHGFSFYDGIILFEPRQKVRLALLEIIDDEIEGVLDKYMPGPPGNRGIVKIIDPGRKSEDEAFNGPLVLCVISAGYIVSSILHFLLAFWLYAVAKSDSYHGVRVWFYSTSILYLATWIILITQFFMISFHLTSIFTTLLDIIFFSIGLFIAKKYLNEKIAALELEFKQNNNSESNKMVEFEKSTSINCFSTCTTFLGSSCICCLEVLL